MKVCRECLQVNGHHPNCPEHNDDDFMEEADIFDAYREQREREGDDVCQR
jgi:hypothetical protein